MLERDVSQKLLVIDGPCKGQRMARPGDEFTFEIETVRSKSRYHYTYCLRRHPLLGLVWASPSAKAVKKV
jgi:hypothetical protein